MLGAGTVGTAVAWDFTHMSPTAAVTVADRDPAALERLTSRLPVTAVAFDAANPELILPLARGHDVVVGALPSKCGYRMLEALCDAGLKCCDVSFMREAASGLDGIARARGAVVVYDCGVAPGLSHALVGAAVATLRTCHSVRIDVGGVPERPSPPFFYKAPFAAGDVLEEYTRPVQLVIDGAPVVVEPLTGVETVDVEGVGRLESFYTDGLRSLTTTVNAREMAERTLRHPGHLTMITALRDLGLFDTTPVRVGAQMVVPRELAATLLFPHWRYAEGERDITVLRVEVTGASAGGDAVTLRWALVDRPQPELTGTLSSMARTTAFPAAIVARWVADGTIADPGVHAPESLGARGLVPPLLDQLRQRGVDVPSSS